MQIDESKIEKHKHQEAVLEVVPIIKEIVLSAEPCEEEEMVIVVAEKIVELLFYILLSFFCVLLKHLLILLFCDLCIL